VKVHNDEYIAADMLVLNSSGPKGAFYVETKNLDGETNLKIRQTQKELQEEFSNEDLIIWIDGEIECEKPNA